MSSNTASKKSKLNFWVPKLEQNKKRDETKSEATLGSGLESLVIWECQLKDNEFLVKRITAFLESTK